MEWKLSAFADEIDDDFDIQLSELHKEGIKLIDLRTAFGKNVLLLSDAELRVIVERASSFGIGFNCVASPINKVVMEFAESCDEFAKLERAIEVAKIIGTSRIRIFTPEGADFAKIREWMDPQVELANRENVILLHENDAHYYGAFPDQAKRLMEMYSSPNFRFAFDFANPLHIGSRAMDDWFTWLLPYLETVHIKDATLEGKICPAGEGVGQLKETLSWLKEQGWSGVLSIEPHLQYAGESKGFSGIESFRIAVAALKGILHSI